jgi:succinate dehydrogenase / fumarate reductase flavoprotein subunit
VCRIAKGGRIRSRVGIAFPDSDVDLPATTKKDLVDLEWGITNGVDYVAISFVRSASDVLGLRAIIDERGSAAGIIAKIERRTALENIEEIVHASDGLMVARGDLGLEVPLEQLPMLQRRLIEEANFRGIPVIVATQMMHSMITSVRPTRAEVSDIAAAVMSGADAVMLCTGGIGMLFGKSTNSVVNTGSSHASAYSQGAYYANGEFIQVHPTAIPGLDKLRLMSESARGEGGRVWTYKDGKPWYFLEEKYPAYGNLVPRDIATREIFDVCVRQKLGVNGDNMVFLDLSHLSRDFLDKRLGAILEIYETFVGDDPRKVPMKIFPGMHYSMGGLWVDYNLMTNVPGLFAGGECNFEYHGANRLGANALLSCTFDGLKGGGRIVDYCKGLKRRSVDAESSLFDSEEARMRARLDQIATMSGTENVYKLHQELGQMMTNYVTVVRRNDELTAGIAKIQELKERLRKVGIGSSTQAFNQELLFVNQLSNGLELAHAIVAGALARDESRGAHYKPEFPERNDESWLKTTKASFTPEGPEIGYEEVDIRFIPPRKRVYNVDKTAA